MWAVNDNQNINMRHARKLAGFDKDIIRLFVMLAAVLIFAGIFISKLFYTAVNFSSMASQFPEFGLLAMGMSLAILTGGADLSVVNVGNLTGIITGSMIKLLIPENPSSGTVALVLSASIVIGLIVGLSCGMFNGFCVAKIGIPPILTTLGTMQLFGGLGIVITKGTAIYGFPETLSELGNGVAFGFIPYPVIAFAIAAILVAFVIQRTKFGLQLYLMGSNPTASQFSGINNTAVLIRTYAISGMLAALAGIVILARNNSASADYGSAYIIQTILVAIMAGFNPSGGKGRITGLILAVITLQMISSGINMTNAVSYLKQLIYGALLLIMVISDTIVINKKKQQPSN